MKKLSLLLLSTLFSTSAIAADSVNNPIAGSYGTWYDGQGEVLEITSKGIKSLANESAKCKKQSSYTHKKITISGAELIKDIKKSITESSDEESDIENYRKQTKQLISMIDKKKKYMSIYGHPGCGDGMFGLIYINEKASIGFTIAPEEYYYLLIKK